MNRVKLEKIEEMQEQIMSCDLSDRITLDLDNDVVVHTINEIVDFINVNVRTPLNNVCHQKIKKNSYD